MGWWASKKQDGVAGGAGCHTPVPSSAYHACASRSRVALLLCLVLKACTECRNQQEGH